MSKDIQRGNYLGRRISLARALIRSDLWRYGEGDSFRVFCRQYVFNPGFRYVFWHRIWNAIDGLPLIRLGIQQFVSWRLRVLSVKFGISLPPETVLGEGFYIGHHGGIVVHPEVRFGRNCNLSQGVTIGLSSRGEKFGCPHFGDSVYIGPGAVVFGAIRIGNSVAIGANAVVTHSVPDSAVVVGVPAKIVSMKGSGGYISNVDY